MASDLRFVEFVCDQIGLGAKLSYRKMFGEYAIYYAGQVVALVCDDQLFVKPTAAGRTVLGRVTEAAPYDGAKPHFLIDRELDDRDTLARLVQATAADLPAPRPRRSKT